jgi:hypothetical protein
MGERVARELVPVLRDEPEQVVEAWAEAVKEHGPEPTAAQVRETVKRRNGRGDYTTPSWALRMLELAVELRRIAQSQPQPQPQPDRPGRHACEEVLVLLAEVEHDLRRMASGEFPPRTAR